MFAKLGRLCIITINKQPNKDLMMELDLSHYENIYFIGDLHGQFDALEFLIREVGITKKDAIVSVGDLIDRGYKNLETLLHFKYNDNCFAVRGNHEDMMIQSSLYNSRLNYYTWMANGGEWSLDYPEQFIKELSEWCEDNIPVAMKITHNGTSFGVVHGECPYDDWEEFTKNLVQRGKLSDKTAAGKAMWGRKKIDGEELFIDNADFTVHGHTPNETPWVLGNQIWIDTCAQDIMNPKIKGRLTALRWDGKVFKEYNVRFDFEKGKYAAEFDLEI